MNFTFSVETADLFGGLERALMTARRGNLKLLSLQLRNNGFRAVVSMRVSADDPDWVGLYLSRLHNIDGVFNVEMTEEKLSPQSSGTDCFMTSEVPA